METNNTLQGMLSLIPDPAFSVRDHILTHSNAAAQALMLFPGADVRELLASGAEEYEAFQGGCLSLTLALPPKAICATVTPMEDQLVFLLEPQDGDLSLQAMALAARQLREPLGSLILSADHLNRRLSREEDLEDLARLNRGLHQLLRLISNMSDAGHYGNMCRMELIDPDRLLRELFEKAQTQLAHTGARLCYRPLAEALLTQADPNQLERAVWNLISNAVKFSGGAGPIEASLTRQGSRLYFRIQSPGKSPELDPFRRYRHPPGVEDSRLGAGLGLVLVRAAAANHGGTLLMDQPTPDSTRFTLTLAIRQRPGNLLRCPVFRVDYTGERDHGLVELSEILPLEAYR